MRSLAPKLLLAFLAVSLTVAVLGAGLIRYTTQRDFAELVLSNAREEFIDRATTYYRATGSWQGYPQFFFRNATQPDGQQPPGQLPPQNDTQQERLQRLGFVLTDENGQVLVPAGLYRPRDIVPETVLAEGVAIEIEGHVVGTVITIGDPPPLAPREQHFLENTNRSLIYATLGATAVALALSLIFTRGLTRPLRELTGAIRTTAKGKLGEQVSVRTKDEIGQLAQAFNQMSAELASLNEQRRQMTADIAHDLRTPLTVISGYVESMQDGVLKPTHERLQTIQDEVNHLQRLVEDLRTLSLADAGELSLNRVATPPQALLEQVEAAYTLSAEQKGVRLRMHTEPELPQIHVDPDRMLQVLGNLVSNAIRHTPEGGEIAVESRQYAIGNGQLTVGAGQLSSDISSLTTNNCLLFTITDSGAGISPEDLPRVFDRFYRVEESRHEMEGESGLGLAIAKSIVEAHGGEITVDSKPESGTKFTIALPI